MLLWLNGRVVPARRAVVSALDRGLLHGDGVYDTWRTYDGRPFALRAHLARLAAGARRLGLPSPGPAARWERLTRRLVVANRLPDAAVRLTITRGAAGDALWPVRRARPTMLLTVRPLPADLARRQLDGVAAVLLPFPRDAGPPWGDVKLVGHASAVLGKRLAARRDAAEGLYVTADGEVTEATTANVFVVERGRVVTPPVEAGVLPGVTRSFVLGLARRAGVRVREERLTVVRLRRADECFLTASSVEIVPVVRLDGRRIRSGRPGRITRQLQSAYARHVRSRLPKL